MSQVEYGVAEHDHHFLVFTSKSTCERLVLRLENTTFPDPLPELCLRGPELLAVSADHQRGFPFLLFFIGAQFTLIPLKTLRPVLTILSLEKAGGKESYTTPEGEASHARRRLNDSEPMLR